MSKIINIFKIFILLNFFTASNQLVVNSQEEKIFLTLKSETVYVRQGHSFDYPIKFVYKKKNLPVKVIDTWDNFKKIQDYENNQGWIHIAKLSKKKAAINIKNNSTIFKKPTMFSKPLAKLEKGRLVLVKKCENLWCKIITGGYTGWIKKKNLWGKL